MSRDLRYGEQHEEYVSPERRGVKKQRADGGMRARGRVRTRVGGFMVIVIGDSVAKKCV